MDPPLADTLRQLWLDALALVWPTQCVVCGADDRDLCDQCRDDLCPRPAEIITEALPSGVRLSAAGPYEDPSRSVVLAFKHAGATGFAKLLAARLKAPLDAVTAGLDGDVFLVAAPSRAARVRERGYQHIEVLIRALRRGWAAEVQMAARDGPQLRHLPRALRAQAGRVAQVGLRGDERRRNAARVTVRRRAAMRLLGAQVVLVDDVVTTGATVTAAAQALTAAGAQVLGVVVLCRVQRHDAADLQLHKYEWRPSGRSE